MTHLITFLNWSKQLCKRYPEKQDARVMIAKRAIEKYYAID